jgi:transposase
MDDHTVDRKSEEFRRIEVITGVGRRRRWTAEAKARIVAESLVGDVSVSEVARRHGIRPQQLFGWRHQARAGQLALAGVAPFVPLVADEPGEGVSQRSGAVAGPAIEIELGDVVVRVRGRVAADALAEVLAAVKSMR